MRAKLRRRERDGTPFCIIVERFTTWIISRREIRIEVQDGEIVDHTELRRLTKKLGPG
jgi:hypothetical protein